MQAARRKAISELLFFASVGDLKRCQRIIQQWNLQVSTLEIQTRIMSDLQSVSTLPPQEVELVILTFLNFAHEHKEHKQKEANCTSHQVVAAQLNAECKDWLDQWGKERQDKSNKESLRSVHSRCRSAYTVDTQVCCITPGIWSHCRHKCQTICLKL